MAGTMIINVAGTSGSGKSTLVRWLMEPARGWNSVRENVCDAGGRVIGSLLVRDGAGTFICGRYEGFDTGGCDTIKNVEFWYDTIVAQHELGRNVVFEGLFVMNHTRGIALARRFREQLHVIRLKTSLDECKAGVNERRARRGDPPKTTGWENTEGNWVRAKNFAFKLKNAGATAHLADRDQARVVLVDLLGVLP
jgi:hypothetical protein